MTMDPNAPNPFSAFALKRENDVNALTRLGGAVGGYPTQYDMGQPTQPLVQGGLPQMGGTQPIAPQQEVPAPMGPAPAGFEADRARIIAGESGGDPNALFGFSNREGGQFAGVNPSTMTLSELKQFTSPDGPYAQFVKSQVGRVATPVGLFQIVGSTLKDAQKALGLSDDTVFDEATQERMAKWIYANQGPQAWEALKKGVNDVQAIAGEYVPTYGGDYISPEQQKILDELEAETKIDPKKLKQQTWGTLLQGLGVGLGQMSQGEQVNVNSVFDRFSERQDQIKKARQDLMRERMRLFERGQDRYNQVVDREDTQLHQSTENDEERQYQLETKLMERGWAKEDQGRMRNWTLEDAMRNREWEVMDALRNRGWTDEDFEKNKSFTIEQAFLNDAITARRKGIDDANLAASEAKKKATLEGAMRESGAPDAVIKTIMGLPLDQAAATAQDWIGKEIDFTNEEVSAGLQRERVRAATTAAYVDKPWAQRAANIAADAPEAYGPFIEQQIKNDSEAADRTRLQDTYEDIAATYEAQSPAAAAILRNADGDESAIEQANAVYLQDSKGDKDNVDIANWKFAQSLPPDQRIDFINSLAAEAGTIPPGQEQAYKVEGTRLTEEGKNMANVRQQRERVHAALNLLNAVDFETGATTEQSLALQKIFDAMGMGEFGQQIVGAESFNAAAKGLISFGKQVGEGSTSDWDGQRYEEAALSLGKSEDANRFIGYTTDRLLARREAEFNAEAKWLHDGRLGEGQEAKDAFIQEQLKLQGLDSEPVMEAKTEDDIIPMMLENGLDDNQPFYFNGSVYFVDSTSPTGYRKGGE